MRIQLGDVLDQVVAAEVLQRGAVLQDEAECATNVFPDCIKKISKPCVSSYLNGKCIAGQRSRTRDVENVVVGFVDVDREKLHWFIRAGIWPSCRSRRARVGCSTLALGARPEPLALGALAAPPGPAAPQQPRPTQARHGGGV